ncbi:MAG: universal stress protein [Chloroflexota bacterium]|nr:universal stress protein [Chloroflexota bacterium]
MVRRILIPVDLTPLGEAKLPVAQEYARAFDAEVVLLHVLPPKALDAEVVSPAEATARAYLDVLVAGMSAAGVRAAALIRTGPTAASILDEARGHQADLIILGANVRPVLRSVVIGSIADAVVRAAPCPVLLVRPMLDAAAPRPLRSFADDAARAGPLHRRPLGLRTVDVGRIIRTIGRARELGPDFRPTQRRRLDDERLERIRSAMAAGASLPPIELYKLGFGYYVLDGHHRVAAARQLGQLELEADVTEFVPLADPEAARTFAERRAFERSTGLTGIGAAHPDTYQRLAAMIEAYRAGHGIADYQDAARRWYAEVYHPLWQRVRARRLTRYFPGDRAADFVARVSAWRSEAADAADLAWDEALDRFVSTLMRRRRLSRDGQRRGSLTDPAPPPRSTPDTGTH